jgi:hypothetical protein
VSTQAYSIIKGRSKAILEKKVIELLAQGWKLQGGVHVIVSMQEEIFYQAMFKVTEETTDGN